MPNGEMVTMKLAERGSLVGATDGMWMREVRKLTSGGHQTSLISTAYDRDALQDALALFSRWCQENFFRYMMEHFSIDALSHSPETKSLFSNLAELSMIRDLTQGGDHGRLFGESGTSDDAAVSIVG